MCMSCLFARCAHTAEVGKHQAPNLMCVRVIKVLLDSLRDCHARCLLKRLAWTAVTGHPSLFGQQPLVEKHDSMLGVGAALRSFEMAD
mmetsp:Transcript_62892/g.205340  ORF Transcript_62892/g.205340 Transcript_62892/m.205340 type:complete len:88 (+) Transcript_62892:379-642(+)